MFEISEFDVFSDVVVDVDVDVVLTEGSSFLSMSKRSNSGM